MPGTCTEIYSKYHKIPWNHIALDIRNVALNRFTNLYWNFDHAQKSTFDCVEHHHTASRKYMHTKFANGQDSGILSAHS